jgi:hypothetical protein
MTDERQGPRDRRTRPRHPERPCLNCGDPTFGEFCPSCGQRKVDVQVSVRTMVKDVLEDELLMSRRLPRTLVALLFRPGSLTAEVLNGRIVRYVRPFKLYLMSSVMFFLLLSFLSVRVIDRAEFGATTVPLGGGPDDASAAATRLPALDSAIAGIDADLVRPDLQEAEARVLAATRELLVGQRAALVGEDGGGTGASDAEGSGGSWLEYVEVDLGMPRVDSALNARLRRLGEMEQGEALEEVARTALGYVPTVMFVLLPIFAGVLKLLYVRQRRYYAEHMIFLLHTHAFVFVVFTVLLARGWLFGWMGALLGWTWLTPAIVTLLLGWALVYIYLAMKRVYGQGWLKTFLKYWTLGWAYFWILLPSILVLLVATVFLIPG